MPVQPLDAELERTTGEPHIDGYPLYSGLPPPSSKCMKCGGAMKAGVAMGQTFTGIPDFPGGEICTVSPGGPGRLVPCSKCSACGWSVSIGDTPAQKG